MRKKAAAKVDAGSIEDRIYLVRAQRVMLDSDLAVLYGVSTKRLNEQVKRNKDRFPPDFMFKLTDDEADHLRSQIATSNTGRGGRRTPPNVFTEHGAIMLASVLNSQQAVDASVFVVRAFVRMREILSVHKQLERKLNELERKVGSHDDDIRALVAALRQLMRSPRGSRKRIGFNRD